MKDKTSEFDKELEKCIKPLTDFIQSACKKFQERFRYAVIRNGGTQQVTNTRAFAEMLAGKNDELWLAYVENDNSIELLWRLKDD